MEATPMIEKKQHHGHNIKRLRTILNVKQETLATELKMTQQSVSKLEDREIIEDDLLAQISRILNVPVDTIKNYNDDATVNYITQNFNDNAVNHNSNVYGTNNYNFDPTDRQRLIEVYEKRLQEKEEEIEKLKQEKK